MYKLKSDKTGLTTFFKNHPHKEGIIVSEQKKFIYMKPTKTAGTTVLRHFLEKEIKDIFHLKDHPKEFLFWLNAITDKELEEYFIFVVVRNPFDRFVSSSSYLKIQFNKLLYDFDNYAQKEKIRVHTLPQFFYTHNNGKCFVDFICRFECLQADINIVCDHIGLKRTTLPITNKSKHKPFEKYYNKSDIRKLEQIYPEDIKHYGYNLNIFKNKPRKNNFLRLINSLKIV